MYERKESEENHSPKEKKKVVKSGYVSKKAQAILDQQVENDKFEAEKMRFQRNHDEEDYGWSKHIMQLQHFADIVQDYNFLVDSLEDEH